MFVEALGHEEYGHNSYVEEVGSVRTKYFSGVAIAGFSKVRQRLTAVFGELLGLLLQRILCDGATVRKHELSLSFV